jgi:transposase
MTRQERIKKILELCARGYSYADVAAIMGCTKAAISGALDRARKAQIAPPARRGRPPRKPDVERHKLLEPPAPVAAPAWQSRFLRPQDRRASR